MKHCCGIPPAACALLAVVAVGVALQLLMQSAALDALVREGNGYAAHLACSIVFGARRNLQVG